MVDVGAVKIGHGAVDDGVAADLAVQVESRRTLMTSGASRVLGAGSDQKIVNYFGQRAARSRQWLSRDRGLPVLLTCDPSVALGGATTDK